MDAGRTRRKLWRKRVVLPTDTPLLARNLLLRLCAASPRLSRMENEEIARRFERFALLLELRGEDFYRIRSYRNAAEIINDWPTPLRVIAAEDGLRGLQAIPGVGKAISGKVMELLARGSFEAWDRVTAETPASALNLLQVDGIGIKTAAALHQQFKISSLKDLAQFVAGGGLELVDGVGEKTAERIADSLRELLQNSDE